MTGEALDVEVKVPTTEMDASVRKRGGSLQGFDRGKIARAVRAAFKECDNHRDVIQEELVEEIIRRSLLLAKDDIIPIETVQDTVEAVMMDRKCHDVAKAYILYRERRRMARERRLKPDGKALKEYIHLSKYARYQAEQLRRELPHETVFRREQMDLQKFPLLEKEIRWAFEYTRRDEVMPAMRSMQFGGAAIQANNNRIFNCSYTLVDRPRVFGEAFHLLLSGAGVGYSVQFRHVNKLPKLKPVNKNKVWHFVVPDTIEGWGEAVNALVESYVKGGDYVEFAYHLVRAKGAQLKISGGKAPGHLPLKKALEELRQILEKAATQGRRLRTLECHDMMCHLAEAVLSGGIRRSSLIAMFSLEDGEMFYCKSTDNYNPDKKNPKNAHRAMANNSVVLLRGAVKKEDFQRILEAAADWGEPGFYFTNDLDYGSNPCGEIGLNPVLTVTPEVRQIIKDWELETGWRAMVRKDDNRPVMVVPRGYLKSLAGRDYLDEMVEDYPDNTIGLRTPKLGEKITGFGFCNLCEINGATVKSAEDFYDRCRAASIMGTCQASYTRFKYLTWVSEIIARREALLGVGITGIMDNPKVLLDPDILQRGSEIVVETNVEISRRIGIRPAARCTTIKPSGTTSLRFGCVASGCHPHKGRRFFRRVVANEMEPVFQYFRSQNPHMCEQMPSGDWVVCFAVEAPENAITDDDLNGVEFLKVVQLLYKHWIKTGTARPESTVGLTHNVSNTVTILEGHQERVAEHLWENKEEFGACSFLPYMGDKKFPYAPYERVSTVEDEARWNALLEHERPVDYSQMVEVEDGTDHTMQSACPGGQCEVHL